MADQDDQKLIPDYLVETIENLFHCLSLSQQNEMSFPSSLLAHERAYIHRKAMEEGYYTVTRRGIGFSDRHICILKSKPRQIAASKYPIVILHDALKKVVHVMEMCPLTMLEFRSFVLTRDHDDIGVSETDITKVNNDIMGSDLNFSVLPSQHPGSMKANPVINEYRKSLPIYNYKQVILSYLAENQVLIIYGGIASGKSTQVPQYLMEKCLDAKVGYKIFLCEPYRITTVAIAERIAFERREQVGQTVGYQIPLETKKSATSIVICLTPEVLLKMLVAKEPAFQGKVIVILDEFDECDYTVEFLLIALKDLFKVNGHLRLILMSNSMDISSLFSYFQCPKTECDEVIKTASISVNSNLIPVQEFFLEDILMRTDYVNRCKIMNSIASNGVGYFMGSGIENDVVQSNTIEVIDLAMEKVWNIGEDDGFVFLLNMMKKDVISVNYQLSSNGVTLLMAASYAGKIKYVMELVKTGADVTIRCQNGLTAVDWASKKNNFDIVEFLQYYLICNNEKVVPDREFIKLTASTNFNEHTKRLIMYYDNFYPEDNVDFELLFTVVLHIHAFSKPGAMIIFLPSFFDILVFRDILLNKESELVTSGGSFILRYLYSNMQTNDQKMIFQIPPPDCRKIILSTNVGAVGITISDLVYVIDTGKIEQKMYVNHTGKVSFVTSWISESHAMQRCTKIGRLQPGCCYRLYPQLMTLPEKNPLIKLYTRSPQILCLYTKQIVPTDVFVMSYLQRAFIVPDVSTIKQAVDILKSIDAFDISRNFEQLTEFGKIMLQLPLEPQYAKMVLFAVALKCLDPILTIAAFSKHKSIFKLEQNFKKKSHSAAKEWKKIGAKYFSDHLVLIKMFLGRQEAGIEKREKEFCDEFCLSQSTLELVNTTRSNIVGHLRAMGIVKTRGVNDMRDLNANSREWIFVKAALVGGLYPNVIFVDRVFNKLYSTKDNEEVVFHPLSVLLDYSSVPSNQSVMLTQSNILQQLPTDWIICNDISNSYSDEICTASVCTSVSALTLALFAGSYKICSATQNEKMALAIQNNNFDTRESDSENEENSQNLKTFMINSHLQFTMSEDAVKAVMYLRIKWFSYFFRCIRFPSKSMTTDETLLIDTIGSILKNEEKYKFPAGDPCFIGQKPAAYVIDLFQQPRHNKSLADVNVVASVPVSSGLITENSRYFLIKSYKSNNITASILNGVWKFEKNTEITLLEVFKTGAEVKLIFQLEGTNCFQGMAMLLSDHFCGSDNFLPIQWLKDGLVPITAVEEYLDYTICNKLKASVDGMEIDCPLASTLVMMWNTSHMLIRGAT